MEYKEFEYHCEKCKDTHYILQKNEDGYEVARECECKAIREALRHMRQSGISKEFAKQSFDNYEDYGNEQLAYAKNTAIQYTNDFIEHESDRNNSIMFMGQVGAGKTHLGIAICSSLIQKGVAVIYMPYRNAITSLKQHIMDEIEYKNEIDKYCNARVLFIDDFLKGKLTETDVNIMYEIINYRYMNNLLLIISTEKVLVDLLQFDEAVGSRIVEMCKYSIVKFEGNTLNYRLYGGKAS